MNYSKTKILMIMKKLILGLATALLLAACSSGVKVENLRVEMQENPIALGVKTPRFSWQIKATGSDVFQTAYRIEVAATEKALKAGDLLWTSGEVLSGESILIPYEGPALQSRQSCYWRVKATTNQGETAWSPANRWTMALLDESDWSAQWIGLDAMVNPGETQGDATAKGWMGTRLAARYMRTDFQAPATVSRATLYIAGLGSSEAYLNGKLVAEDIFAPVPSVYTDRVYYETYDVTSLVQSGENTLGVILGNGRYFAMRNPGMSFFGLPRLRAQLEITLSDGTIQTVVTDPATWTVTSNGPIVANNEFDGEEYDERLEMPGWNQPGFAGEGWQKADAMSAPGGVMEAQPNPPLRIMERISPVSVTALPDGRYILDMGQNMVGWLKVKLPGKTGSPVTLRFSELLQADGTLYMDNLRNAKVTDIYTPAQDGTFEWEPRFVYHGFRFVEISGLDAKPALESFTGCVIYDQMETTGSFETSNSVINQVYKNAYWGIRGNYRGFPTDCPQRDERQGWLGDRTTGAYGEAFVFGNGLFYGKWLQDIEDSQSPQGSISDVSPYYWTIWSDDVTWPAAYFQVADMLYRQYGDVSGITRHYASMKKWIDHLTATQMKDYILQKDSYGDWCMPPESLELIHAKDPARKTSGQLLSTAMFYHLLQVMGEFATLSGHDADIPGYLELAAKIKESYNTTFFDPSTARYDNNTVTANILSLMLGLVPAGYEEQVMENIIEKTEGEFNGHVSVGVLGIQQLMRGLTAYGHEDLAYKIATNETYPSWGYMAANGATTIWELWNGNTAAPAMNSCNHVMLLGDLLIWYYENLAAIQNDPSSIAFKKVRMEPTFPDGLEWVNASYDSPYGMIKSAWSLKDGAFDWRIEIPANSSAELRLPASMGTDMFKGSGVRSVTETGDQVIVEIGSGSYRFTSVK